MTTRNVYDYVNELRAKCAPNTKQCNFSILCDKYPMKAGEWSYLGKVLYVSIKIKDKCHRFYPDKLKELDLDSIFIKPNSRRKITEDFEEFYINGNTTTQEYQGIKYYNYSIAAAPTSHKPKIDALKQKYQIESFDMFIGEQLDLVL